MKESDPLESILKKVDLDKVSADEPAEPVEIRLGKFLPPNRAVVAVFTDDDEIREWLDEHLSPVVEGEGYRYNDSPTSEEAVDARILIMDVRPEFDAHMHPVYDKVCAIKRTKGRLKDMICVFERRERYGRFPRGTYPGLYYFCLDKTDLDGREPDLPLEGLPTEMGPRLHNFSDMPAIVQGNIHTYIEGEEDLAKERQRLAKKRKGRGETPT